MVGHCRDILQGILCRALGTAGILGGWALQGYLVVGHCRDTLRLGTAGILGGRALQGYLVVGHCRDTWWLGTAGILGDWAQQGYLMVGHCRDTLRKHCRDTHWLGTAGILGGWSLKSASSRARTTSTLKSNNPTARVGNKQNNDVSGNSRTIMLANVPCCFCLVVPYVFLFLFRKGKNKQVATMK